MMAKAMAEGDVREAEQLVPFKMSELKHDSDNFQGRMFNFMRMTNPLNLLAGEQ